MRDVVLRDVEVDGDRRDVVIGGGVVGAPADPDAVVVDGAGGALLPGLHDHHLHLLATAAAARSVVCGPPMVRDADQLRAALVAAPGPVVRGIGYHDSVAGELHRDLLDRLVDDRPVRVQHRTGGLWALNSRALEQAGIDAPDGRLWRGGEGLLADDRGPDLAALGLELALLGVLGVCDATPDLAPEALGLLVDADLPQLVLTLGAPDEWDHPRVRRGPRKILLGDEDLDWDALIDRIEQARAASRAVAVHAVTREAVLLVIAALDQLGVVQGDRIEHAAVVPADVVPRLQGLTVVTQPALAAAHGDDYRRDVDPRDYDDLWRHRSLLAAGIPTVCSSDAPYGSHDPWEVLRQARDRRTPDGEVLGASETVPVRTALGGMLSPLDDPGGRPRRVAESGDLVLLHVPLEDAMREPSADLVRLVCAAR